MVSSIVKLLVHTILIINLTVCCSAKLFSQSTDNVKSASVNGNIIDHLNAPIVAASVSLMLQDSTVVNRAISNVNGEFNITSVKPGAYQLRIQYVGFKTFYTALFTIIANEVKVMPGIIITALPNTLNEVVVLKKKQVIEIRSDKIIFNVAGSPDASGINGLDLLRKSPGVTVDMDNNIALLGKSGVQIYINGVQSRLSGSDLTTFLQSITSDNIEALEIISNPSSKYDAEGTAGIINIKMKKNLSTGFNGSATSSFTKGLYYRSSNSLSLNYRGSKVRLNAELTEFKNTDFEKFVDSKD